MPGWAEFGLPLPWFTTGALGREEALLVTGQLWGRLGRLSSEGLVEDLKGRAPGGGALSGCVEQEVGTLTLMVTWRWSWGACLKVR